MDNQDGNRGQMVTLLMIGTMTIMAGATISPALPQIEAQIATGPNGPLLARLVLTIPALFTALTALFAGAAIDRFGRRGILIGAILLYGIAGPAGGLASSVIQLLITRALLGVSVGIIMTAGVTLITDYYEGAHRDTVMGRQAAFSSIGGIVFLLTGGVLADLSWRAPFGIYLLAFPILALVLLFIIEPDRTRNEPTTDKVPARPDLLPVIGLAALASTSMILFYLTPVQVPFYLSELGTSSGTISGIAIAAVTLTGAIASASYGRIRTRLGHGQVFALLYLLMAAGYAIVASATDAARVVGGLALFGCGIGLLIPAIQSRAGELATPATRGIIIGTVTTSIFLGQFASPFVTQPLIAAFGSAVTFGLASGTLVVLGAGFGIWALVNPHRPRKGEPPR